MTWREVKARRETRRKELRAYQRRVHNNPEPMHTITLTQEELEAATDALDTTLIEFEQQEDLTDTARYETLKALYTKLLNRQFTIQL